MLFASMSALPIYLAAMANPDQEKLQNPVPDSANYQISADPIAP